MMKHPSDNNTPDALPNTGCNHRELRHVATTL